MRSRQDGEAPELKLAPLRPAGGRPPLFCLPGAGGAVSIFGALASLMDDGQPVYAIDMGGVFAGDRRLAVEPLAEACCAAIRQAQPRGPYHLCGYSFGALVAYEAAARLKRDGDAVGVVALIDTGNPAFGRRQSSVEARRTQRTYLSNRIRKYFGYLARGEVRSFAASLGALLASRVGVRARRAIRRALLALGRPMPLILQNNDPMLVEAWLAYDPPPSAAPLLLFYESYRQAEYGGDPSLGWGLCASGKVEVELASGGHVDMMGVRHARRLAARLSEIMRDRPGPIPPPDASPQR